MKVLLMLPHRQVAIERGFFVNKTIEIKTLKETSYILQKYMYDVIKFAGSLHNIPITHTHTNEGNKF